MERKSELLAIVRQDPMLMDILRIAQSVDLPNWYVGAGVIRNAVWDYLSGYPGRTKIRDVDLVYFSDEEVGENSVKSKLEHALPGIVWDFKNSKDVHRWYKEVKNIDRPPLRSSEEDIDMWPETASCIGLRLVDNEIIIYAPYGIDDLMNMVFRRNTFNKYSVSAQVFEKRLKDKGIQEKWPLVKVIYE